jgi:chitin synthase
VVKCGTEKEAATEKKPGNRGKRDSQLILMNFFSRVTYNDRMSPLDFDLFRKIHILTGVTPDFFEVCLMVSLEPCLGVARVANEKFRLMLILKFTPSR